MNKLKSDNTKKITLKKHSGTDDYNYNEIYNDFSRQIFAGPVDDEWKLEDKKCTDLLGHLPVIHGPDQNIIKDVAC